MHQFTLHQGDCLDVMRSLADASIDAICTDPPYGIRFMGNAWDGDDIEAQVAKRRAFESHDPRAAENGGYKSIAAAAGTYDRSLTANQAFAEWTRFWAVEALRVLKPGGHLVSFASTRTYHRMVCGIEDAGFEIRDQIAWVFGTGMPKSHNLRGEHEGWGTALKPAFEPVVLARKPPVGTVAQNVQAFGTGALHIDACRVGTEAIASSGAVSTGWRATEGRTDRQVAKPSVSVGRWPANLAHDGSDEVVGHFPSEAGQQSIVRTRNGDKTRHVFGEFAGSPSPDFVPHDGKGSAARFFYCAKASRTDRNEGVGGSDTPAVQMNATMRDREDADWPARNGNHHPTVKPTDLMRWLCRLVTPPGGTVLDPFMGSGSTGKAAILEGFGFIGIEREAEYLAIARARIEHATLKADAANDNQRQRSLFDDAA